ncbi:hypothetical protein [Desulfopila aestuarii]|uniref:Uncharacterized protein n=1 Tax=Desulfopila aestuarii DSM 18488 TaxID=1121416 RepID=A0A1M7Y2L4_9BACT|nr:hypothetical protein [Desulfopila aestuarii]SHO46133.1 hypothetical protein SAMN02745220_01312 [Desulfopila aestuarii DSM 18488]
MTANKSPRSTAAEALEIRHRHPHENRGKTIVDPNAHSIRILPHGVHMVSFVHSADVFICDRTKNVATSRSEN